MTYGDRILDEMGHQLDKNWGLLCASVGPRRRKPWGATFATASKGRHFNKLARYYRRAMGATYE